MATLGPRGLRRIAEICYANAHQLAERLEATGRFKVLNDGPFFNEFTVACDEAPAALNRRLRDQGIIGGLDLGQIDVALDGRMLLCATEMTGADAIERFVAVASAA
jgi:glycine dehydrogenase subunit 1